MLDGKNDGLGEKDDVFHKNDDWLGGNDTGSWKDDKVDVNADDTDVHAAAGGGNKVSRAKRPKCKNPKVGFSNYLQFVNYFPPGHVKHVQEPWLPSSSLQEEFRWGGLGGMSSTCDSKRIGQFKYQG